jgi:hypothetical protein
LKEAKADGNRKNGLTAKTAAQLRLLERLLISYNDFHHALRIASYILEKRLLTKVSRTRGIRRSETKLLWEALNSAMIIAYCRPFSGNDRRSSNKIPDLPSRFLKGLTKKEREVHDIAINDRNTLLAHSDSEAWNMRFYFSESSPGRRWLILQHQYARAPLIGKAVRILKGAAIKLREKVFAERMALEKELADHIPVITMDDRAQSEKKEG